MSEKNNPFNILGSESRAPMPPAQASSHLKERIQELIASSPVFLFMKGSPEAPMCGFSANVVDILNSLKVSFKTFDILSDMEIRQGVKEYSNWPTYPQLYFKGELLGGNDIITEMFKDGELAEALELS